jgi:uncharacterized membrane protein YedE/YeeE
MRTLAALLAGAVFGTGIAVSGMINPAKVQNFFDFAGTWDPSLAFVMGGALLVTFIGYRLVLKRPAPVFATKFHLPTKKNLDLPLLAGAATFGVGWGITGFCPGGSIPALGLAQPNALVFIASMIAGVTLARLLHGRLSPQPALAADPEATSNG